MSPIASFGRRLRDERERRGITLETIAASTRINASFLAALERGDVSTWPSGGIFRRAFVREYATAIGVSPEPIVAEFARLFPDPDTAENTDIPEPTSDLRMSLAIDGRGVTPAQVIRAMVALLEACLIVAMARAAARVAGADVWTVCAIMALTYYPLATAWLGRSPALWCVQSGFHSLRKPARRVDATDTREMLHLVTRSSPETSGEPVAQDSACAAPPLRVISR